MDRRQFIRSGIALALVGGLARQLRADAPASAEAARARAIYDDIFDAALVATPQLATTLGLDVGAHASARSKLDDRSRAGRLQGLGPLAGAWPQLQTVEAGRLAGRDRSDFEAVAWLSSISREIAAVPFGGVDAFGFPVPYVLSQITGAYQSVPDFLASQHPLESGSDAEAYLARLQAFAQVLRDESGRVRDDLARGVVPPDFVTAKTLAQLELLRAQHGEQAGLVAALVRRTRSKGIAGGWALYAEQLADEIGMYHDFPIGRLGLLQSFLYRAVRIVVDTGMHWQGWSREQAIGYMGDVVGLAPGAVENEIDRYCVWPGQACGYKIGHLEIIRLRQSAQQKLGERFDLRRFHDVILRGGAMPLEVLEQVVDDWVAQA
jgi:uncharacterized protein (DUF885 family)